MLFVKIIIDQNNVHVKLHQDGSTVNEIKQYHLVLREKT